MALYEVIFEKKLTINVEASSNEEAVDNALETLNDGERVEFDRDDLEYVYEMTPEDVRVYREKYGYSEGTPQEI